MNLLKKIYTILEEREESNFESEADHLYYIITYDNDQVEIYEIEEYRFRGDDWGVIDRKNYHHKIGTIEASIYDYIDTLIAYANLKSYSCSDEILQQEYGNVYYSYKFKMGGLV